jgi:hypothetical protein
LSSGFLLEIKPFILTDLDDSRFRREVLKLWVIDRNSTDETIIYAELQEDQPKVGERIWWQEEGKIYFDNDTKFLVKVGYSVSLGKE